MQELTQAAITIAKDAGKILKRAWEEGGSEINYKGAIDLVTSADHAAEEFILEQIQRAYPEHHVLAEESGLGGGKGTGESDYRWVVDPLDGTVNFAHNIPHFAVLIAIQKKKDEGGWETISGITVDPLRDEIFVAEAGAGATLNGKKIQVSQTPFLIQATLTTGFAYDRLTMQNDNHAEFCRLNLLTRGVRRMGSAGLDLAWVAAGRMDGYWEHNLQPWDVAAGALTVKEAGGAITKIDGSPFVVNDSEVLCANPVLHSQMKAALKSTKDYPINSRLGLDAFLPAELAKKIERRS
ncbi:inositol monophosphatase [Myxococcota bacterium]|nr:inositol monophosphatase [Myxococcota bacterium]